MSSKNIFWVALGGNNKTYAGGNANLVFAAEENNVNDLSDCFLIDWGNCYIGPKFSISRFVIPNLYFLFPSVNSGQQPIPKFILVTHDHPDHLEGIVRALLQGRKLPVIVGSEFTLDVLKNRLKDEGYEKEIKTFPVKANETYDIDGWKITPVSVSHSTGECLGFHVEKYGKSFLHLGDFKNDTTVLLGPPTDYSVLEKIQKEKGVDTVLLDGIYGDQDSSKDDDDIREKYRNEFNLNEGKRIIFAFYGGYLELAANLIAVATEYGYTVVVAGSILEKRLQSLERVRESIADIIAEKTGLFPCIYVEGDEALKTIDKNKTIVLTDIVPHDPKSFLGRLFKNRNLIPETMDHNDTVYVTGTVIKYGGYTNSFKPFAKQLQNVGVTTCYKEKGKFHDAIGHASWIGISRVIHVTKPKTAIFIYAREKELTGTFQRASFFSNVNRVNPSNGQVFQIMPYKPNPVANWGESWIEINIKPSNDRRQARYRNKRGYKL